MMKKTLVQFGIGLGLLAVTTLSGCVVYSPPAAVYAPAPGAVVYAQPAPAVVVAPVVPVFGWGWGWHGGGRWR
jgi:hypothetical protein